MNHSNNRKEQSSSKSKTPPPKQKRASFLSLITKAETTYESHRREQEKIDREERAFLQLGEAARQQRLCRKKHHRHGHLRKRQKLWSPMRLRSGTPVWHARNKPASVSKNSSSSSSSNSSGYQPHPGSKRPQHKTPPRETTNACHHQEPSSNNNNNDKNYPQQQHTAAATNAMERRRGLQSSPESHRRTVRFRAEATTTSNSSNDSSNSNNNNNNNSIVRFLQETIQRLEDRLAKLQANFEASEAAKRNWKTSCERLTLEHTTKYQLLKRDQEDALTQLQQHKEKERKLKEEHSELEQDYVSREVKYEERVAKLRERNEQLQRQYSEALRSKQTTTENNDSNSKQSKELLLQQETKFAKELATLRNEAKAARDTLVQQHARDRDALVRSKRAMETKLHQNYQVQLEQLTAEASAKEASYEKSRRELLKCHQNELTQARSKAANGEAASSPAATAQLQERLDRQTQEHADLQRNFVTIAMQNSRQSTLIETLQAELRQLKQHHHRDGNAALGGSTMPLKIED